MLKWVKGYIRQKQAMRGHTASRTSILGIAASFKGSLQQEMRVWKHSERPLKQNIYIQNNSTITHDAIDS